ncbi:F-box/FBD/LRR-repeat protein At1g13570-like [Rutidosis leptorrhynchoides]|uniref:F-box/FBD/LRR-repeat protein At1g13570-like n=1 Tax=Rutidosis leptorrhynchoides TaxID=125765 RepID=UPI003A9A0C54
MDSSVLLNIDNNTKRRFITSTELDRISYLPENLIDSILEKLPIQDAVRTNVLSKKWEYKWTTMSSLVFDKYFSEKFAKNGVFGRNGFIRITNQVFNFFKGPILKLHLHIPNMALDSFQEVDQWILSLSRDGVIRELVLTNSNQRYQLPRYFFHCLELRMLELENCTFKPPHDFQGFLYLKDLVLKDIEFGANLHGTIINLPQLNVLKLCACTNVYNFKINSTNLVMLVVRNCPDATLLQLLHCKCLSAVGIVFQKPIQGVERINLASLLSNMPCLWGFVIDGYFLGFSIEEKIPKWLPHPANSLKHLSLQNFKFGDLFQLQGILCILRNSPNLERLDVDNEGLRNVYLDVKPAITYLEASDCLDQTLNRLKTINMMHVERSRALLLFIKLLLDHSPTLENISIRPNATADAFEKYNFAKDVTRFPRASSKAELHYLYSDCMHICCGFSFVMFCMLWNLTNVIHKIGKLVIEKF